MKKARFASFLKKIHQKTSPLQIKDTVFCLKVFLLRFYQDTKTEYIGSNQIKCFSCQTTFRKAQKNPFFQVSYRDKMIDSLADWQRNMNWMNLWKNQVEPYMRTYTADNMTKIVAVAELFLQALLAQTN